MGDTAPGSAVPPGAPLRRGLPRTAGGEPWPPAGEAPLPAARAAAGGGGEIDRHTTAEPESAYETPPTAGRRPVATDAADSATVAPAAAAAADGTAGDVRAAGSQRAAAPGLRRGLPRSAGGEPWPPALAGAARATAGSEVGGGPPAPSHVAAESSAPAPTPTPTPTTAPAPAAATQRRRVGLPRPTSGSTTPSTAVGTGAEPTSDATPGPDVPRASGPTTSAGETVAPAAPERGATAASVGRARPPRAPIIIHTAAGVAAATAAAPPASVRATAAARTAAAASSASTSATASATAAATTPPAVPIGIARLWQLPRPAQIALGLLALLVVAAVAVLAVRGLTTYRFVQDFLQTYPGEYSLPDAVDTGFPAWIGWQHFLNAFFIVLIIRSGWQVRSQKRPSAFWTARWAKTKRKISLTLWFHQFLDVLWLLNGVVFVVLIFLNGHWLRLVPSSWGVFPNALSALIHYLTLEWPTDNGWVNYNSLQQLMYFIVVFIAAPLAAITGVRMSGIWPKEAKRLNRVYPVEVARAIHFPVMLFFVGFVIVHVALVFATGALRNLNHMYASSDDVNWIGFGIFFASLVAMVAAWIAARPLVIAPLASLFGTVSNR